jgi:hypothetical protein
MPTPLWDTTAFDEAMQIFLGLYACVTTPNTNALPIQRSELACKITEPVNPKKQRLNRG